MSVDFSDVKMVHKFGQVVACRWIKCQSYVLNLTASRAYSIGDRPVSMSVCRQTFFQNATPTFFV